MNYLNNAIKVFTNYKSLADKAMEQLEDEQLFWQPNAESNSIAIIAKHMWGNMLSRWTNFLTEDGEKEWRQRDAEFENNWKTRVELISKWEEGWQVLFEALNSITDADLDRTVYIRGEAHTVLDAITRQIAHYASHVGQIIYIAKMVKNDAWKSLSIPRNQSKEFNKQMFDKGKH